MTLRLQGLVRAARQAQARLRDGMPPEERAAFLEDVARAVQEVEEACAGYDATPSDLTVPSRRAFEALRDIAGLSLDEIPPPHPGPASSPVLRIGGIVGTLQRCLDVLSDPERRADTALIRAEARRCVDSVETICRDEGVGPASLPPRSARAFTMLAWLRDRENTTRYVDQVRAAEAAWFSACEEDVPERALTTRICFAPGTRPYVHKVRRGKPVLLIDVGYLAGDRGRLDDLCHVVRAGRAADPGALRRDRQFRNSAAYAAIHEAFADLLWRSGHRTP